MPVRGSILQDNTSTAINTKYRVIKAVYDRLEDLNGLLLNQNLSEDEVEQLLIDTYAKYCRYLPFGEGHNDIDEEGFNYWKNQLLSGAIPLKSFSKTIEVAMNQNGWYQKCHLQSQTPVVHNNLTAEQARKLVIYEYCKYGRGPQIGTDLSKDIDQEGLDNWVNALVNDTMNYIDFQITFFRAMIENGYDLKCSITSTNTSTNTDSCDNNLTAEQARTIVIAEYAKYGRGPAIGDARNEIDQAGLDYWITQLSTNNICLSNFPETIRQGMAEHGYYPTDSSRTLNISNLTELNILIAGQSNIANYLSLEPYTPTKEVYQLGLDKSWRMYKSPIVKGGVAIGYTIDTTDTFHIDWGATQDWIDGEEWVVQGTTTPNGSPRKGLVSVTQGVEGVQTAYTIDSTSTFHIDWGDESRYIDGEEFIVDGTIIPNGSPRRGIIQVSDVNEDITHSAYTLGGTPSIDWNSSSDWIDGEVWEVVGDVIPNGSPRRGIIQVSGEATTKTAYTLGGSPSISWGSAANWIDGEEWYVVGTTIPNGSERKGIIEVTTTTTQTPHTTTTTKTAYTIAAGSNFSLPLGAGWTNGEEWYAVGTVAPGKVARGGRIYTDGSGNVTSITLDHEGQYVQGGIGTSGYIRGKSSGKTANWSGAIVVTNGTYTETTTTYTTSTSSTVGPKAISANNWVTDEGQYVQGGIGVSGIIKGRSSGATAYYSNATVVSNGTYTELSGNTTASPKAISPGKWVTDDGQYTENGIGANGTIRGVISGATITYSNGTVIPNGTYKETITTKQITNTIVTEQGQYVENGIGVNGTLKTTQSNLTIHYTNAKIIENGTYGGVGTKSVGPKAISNGVYTLNDGQYVENGIGVNGTLVGSQSGAIATYTNAQIIENGTYVQDKVWDLASGERGNYLGRLGDKLIEAYPNLQRVNFVNVAVGGTKASWWREDASSTVYPTRDDDKFEYQNNKLFERINFVKNSMIEKNKPIHMMLWHQGESDGVENTPKNTYKADLSSVFTATREALGVEVPIFCSTTSYAWGTTYPSIIEAQTEVINEMHRVYLGVETDKYGSAYRHDNIHFNLLGMTSVSDEWVNKIKGAEQNGSI